MISRSLWWSSGLQLQNGSCSFLYQLSDLYLPSLQKQSLYSQLVCSGRFWIRSVPLKGLMFPVLSHGFTHSHEGRGSPAGLNRSHVKRLKQLQERCSPSVDWEELMEIKPCLHPVTPATDDWITHKYVQKYHHYQQQQLVTAAQCVRWHATIRILEGWWQHMWMQVVCFPHFFNAYVSLLLLQLKLSTLSYGTLFHEKCVCMFTDESENRLCGF